LQKSQLALHERSFERPVSLQAMQLGYFQQQRDNILALFSDLLPSFCTDSCNKLGMKRLSISSENNLPMFQLNALVVISAKVKKCEQMLLFIAMHC